MTKLNKTLIAFLLAIGFMAGFSLYHSSLPLKAATFSSTFDSANMTSTVLTLKGGNINAATGSTAIFKLGGIYTGQTLATGTYPVISNPNRSFGQIQNTGNAPAFCLMSATTTISGTSTFLTSSTYGFILQPSSTPNSEWNTQPTGGNLYAGQVWCVAGTATTTLSVEED